MRRRDLKDWQGLNRYPQGLSYGVMDSETLGQCQSGDLLMYPYLVSRSPRDLSGYISGSTAREMLLTRDLELVVETLLCGLRHKGTLIYFATELCRSHPCELGAGRRCLAHVSMGTATCFKTSHRCSSCTSPSPDGMPSALSPFLPTTCQAMAHVVD